MSKKIDKVEHEGRIIEISPDYISVEIINKSACAECHAKGVCVASDQEIRVIEVAQDANTLTQDWEVGEKVNVILKSSMGLQAVVISYLIPLLILIILLLSLSRCGWNELAVGLGSMAGVAIYYVFVFIFRKKLKKIFIFSIEKTI